MKKSSSITHCFVENFPSKLEKNTLYISLEFASMSHLCCCGCGNEIVTPLDPNDWRLTFDGKAISVHPSIGNWSLACRSHYIIRNNQIIWAENWSDAQVKAGRQHDLKVKRQKQYDNSPSLSKDSNSAAKESVNSENWLVKIKRFLGI
ncbi:hypothetical protein KFE96_01695 [Kordiimonas sp. SCSIO 12603]|uniref:DUF6527 family protein n=1 Tax=Kordiimonas sp. SCSIO 12603 TaxID=2829596 RepID=UPI00210734B0|nr:DUF6527 family protein [Kordiimonas sp. SCSIO 12603]UTW59046.1 hypothetical protein KFE96_01695 [Kordiimonas sp. SCSIO 12603]